MEPTNPDDPSQDYNHPVAYDADNKPLFAHPAEVKKQQTTSDILVDANTPRQKHLQSKADYPDVGLGEEEYIIAAVRRHPIGLLLPIAIGILLVVLSIVFLLNYGVAAQTLQFPSTMSNNMFILSAVILFIALVVVGEYVVYNVYTNNVLFLTNRNIIQKIQISIFSEREQIIGLGNIEDVSYNQRDIFQKTFDFGSIQLTIEGIGSVYKFTYARSPKKYMVTFDEIIEEYQRTHMRVH